MKISNVNLLKYGQKMKNLEKNIWEVIDNFDYYKMIRGIMNEYIIGFDISPRQIVRLYEYIFDAPRTTLTKWNIQEEYEKAKNRLEAE